MMPDSSQDAYTTLPAYTAWHAWHHLAQRPLTLVERVQPNSSAERMSAFIGHTIRTDASAVYGDGFRRALRAFQEVGLQAMLSHLRSSSEFPFATGALT